MLCVWRPLQPKEKVRIRETVVKYEMKAQLQKENWIMFSFFASVPLEMKNMVLLGKRDLFSQGAEPNLCVLKGGLIREKLSVMTQRTNKSTRRLIEFVNEKDFSAQL